MKRLATRCFVLAVAAFLLSTAAEAQSITWHSYGAKFFCGSVERGPSEAVVDGKYKTSVNIHNPHYLSVMLPTGGEFDVPVEFFKKIVLALPQGQPPLPPSCMLFERLDADHALAVTCENIRDQLALSGLPASGTLEGYVVLLVPPFQGTLDTAPPELDVTTLHTARSRAAFLDLPTNGVAAWDVEHVGFKEVRGSPTLVLCD